MTPWTAVHQVPLSVGFSRQEYWSGLPFPPPGDLPDPGIEPISPEVPVLEADSLPVSHQGMQSQYLSIYLSTHTHILFTDYVPLWVIAKY